MPLTRRRFLESAAALAAGGLLASCTRAVAQPRFARYPFSLGVASGYPHASGMTLWTRLAPQPLAGGGMPAANVEVRWDVAEDDAFRNVIAGGTAVASPAWGHSVHVDVSGLRAARPYWYRFHVGDALSSTGRTSTASNGDTALAHLRCALASCQQYEQGYYVAYRHMTREDLDLVVHLGDYIYESSWGRDLVRAHGADQPHTLEQYRNRYGLYKSDEDLQAAHAAFPWIVIWDDHEVQNDYANDRSQDLERSEVFLLRRAAAYQAYYEHMPLPRWARPRGSSMRLHGTTVFGQLASFFTLDARQYRSHQVCARPGRGGSNVVREEECHERLDASLTLLGAPQEHWLHERLSQSRTRWNIIAQTTLMAQADRRAGAGADFWTDGWDGYPRARSRLLDTIVTQRVANPIVVGGDLHMSAVADLKLDFNDPRGSIIATEFVCPSISSQGPSVKRVELLLQENPHIRFANARRGYTTIELTPERATARIRAIASVADRDSSIRDLTTYAVESGRPGALKA